MLIKSFWCLGQLKIGKSRTVAAGPTNVLSTSDDSVLACQGEKKLPDCECTVPSCFLPPRARVKGSLQQGDWGFDVRHT